MKISKIKHHFRTVDSTIYTIIKDAEIELLERLEDTAQYFSKLCREIIAQQLGTGAARAITKRFVSLFPGDIIVPDVLLSFSDQKLRDVGMSWAKVKYVKDLAQKTKDNELDFKNLPTFTDEQVIDELIKVKGIGRWTAEMFLIFALGREDIYSHGDLGLTNAMKKLYSLDSNDVKGKIEEIVQKWSPYRSYGCIALWKSVDG